MERKIGEIFEYNGEWYQCVKGDICADCAFVKKHCNDNPLFEAIGSCSKYYRKDATSVIFKKLEKVGEPYEYYVSKKGIINVQDYLLADPNHTIYNKIEGVYDYLDDKVVIEIKQNKEDMEENKLNLKPFDIQKAREDKPVCTRDGRKARIVCFDRKANTPIVALIECDNHGEILQCVHNDGRCVQFDTSDNDLMMLPEKKEGWVNVYKERIYSTKEEAIEATYDGVTYVDTVKICWEE